MDVESFAPSLLAGMRRSLRKDLLIHIYPHNEWEGLDDGLLYMIFLPKNIHPCFQENLSS